MKKCPLTGKPCAKAILFHITDIKDGKVASAKCCEDCFGQYFHSEPTGPLEPKEKLDFGESENKPSIVTPSDVIDGLLQLMGAPCVNPKPRPRHAEKKCPGCDSTLGDIAKSGKVGCSRCFETFEHPLTNVLYKSHGATKHVGKEPKNFTAKKKEEAMTSQKKMTLEEQISQHEMLMQEAIDVENYERAGALRDSLKVLREKLAVVDELRKQMDEAVRDENYEEASKIKEEVERLNG